MTSMRCLLAILALVVLAPLCSRGGLPTPSSPDSLSPHLPGEMMMDRPFGADGKIIVKLHMADGEELPLMVDTGAPCTILDESLAPKLGPQIGTRRAAFTFNLNAGACGIYRAPRLFAGAQQLLTGPRIFTTKRSRADKGILGVDCLGQYCIQFDFVAGKMAFLDPDHLDAVDLGKPFPLNIKTLGIACFDADLFGQGNMRFVLDTGMEGPFDAMLARNLFQRLLREQPTIGPDLHMIVPDGRAASGRIFPQLNLCGQTYTDLWFSMVDPRPKSVNGLIGLGFLARNKVTFNFPRRTVYLKWVVSAPVAEKSSRLQNRTDRGRGGMTPQPDTQIAQPAAPHHER